MGSKSSTGWRSGPVLEISWLLLLILAASPPRPADDFGNVVPYTEPGATFSWPDEMVSYVIAVANASGETDTHCDHSLRDCYSGHHPLIKNQNLSHSKAMGRNEHWSGSRGSNDTSTACTTVTLSYERSVLTITPDATLGRSSSVELSYTFFGPANGTMRCFPGRNERKDDVCTIYDPRWRPWYRDSTNRLYSIQDCSSSLPQVHLHSYLRNSKFDNGYLWLLSKESSVGNFSQFSELSNLRSDNMLIEAEGIDVQLEYMTSELQMLLKQYFQKRTHDQLFQIALQIQFCNSQIENDNLNIPSSTGTIHKLDGSHCRQLDISYSHQIDDIPYCGSCNMNSNLKKTSYTNNSKSIRLDFIFIFIICGSIVIIIVILMNKHKQLVFFNYNRDSLNDLNYDGESNFDETDPIARIIYENRDDGIILESLNSQSSNQGSSGTIFKVQFLEVVCAMKTFHLHARDDFLKESTILQRLRDDNIVKFYCSFGDSNILMEFMDRDLFTFINKIAIEGDHIDNYNLPLEVALKIMLEIAKGMSYLHRNGIAHQDLKSKNILLKLERQGVTAKVADFGSARSFDPRNPKGFILFPNVNFGTRAWKAPELFHQKRGFIARLFGMYPYIMPKPLDIYGFGIICHELIAGQVPMRVGREPPHLLLGRCPEGLATLIKDCCHTNPLQRPEFDIICERLLELRSSLPLNG